MPSAVCRIHFRPREVGSSSQQMTKPFFFDCASGLTIGDIASMTGAEHRPDIDVSYRIVTIAPLDLGGASDLAYIDNKRYAQALSSTNAGACLMTESFEKHAPKG